MNNSLYIDFEGEYFLLDYNCSHSQLLLRKRVKTNIYSNIDIIFNSIQYISIPTKLKGIEIYKVIDILEIYSLKEKFSFNTDYGYMIYCIKNSEGEQFYLNGGVFGVFANNLDILETSIGEFTWSDLNKLIYWSGDTSFNKL